MSLRLATVHENRLASPKSFVFSARFAYFHGSEESLLVFLPEMEEEEGFFAAMKMAATDVEKTEVMLPVPPRSRDSRGALTGEPSFA